MRRPAGLALVVLAWLAMAGPAAAAEAPALDSTQRSHVAALVAARDVLDPARPGDTASAQAALAILTTRAPGEIDAIRLLQSQPPQTAPARARLDSDIAAVSRGASDPDPAASEAQLRSILAQARYHPDQGPLGFIADLLTRFLQFIFSAGGGALVLVALAFLIGIVVLVVALLVPSLRSPLRRGRSQAGGGGAGLEDVPEYFQAAERLAGAGDFDAAVRALTAGTMEMISGERSFTASPLTVRETFNRSGGGHALRPLLQAFERSYYGHRQTGVDDYNLAAASAHGYRQLAGAAKVAA